MSSDLKGRRAFVTGGSKGIGAAIVRRLRAQGAEVVLSAQDMPLAEALATETGARAVRLDVTDLEAARRAVLDHGPFDILVNNAGQDQHAFFTDTVPEQWRKLLAVNLEAVFATVHAALPGMQAARWGRIINVGSEAGRQGSKGGSVYAAAKGGVIAFTKSIARENGRYGITANVIAPGPVDTPLLRKAVEDGGEKLLAAMKGATLLGRLGTPEEVAAAVAFLASEEAGFVTGETLGVSGGMGVLSLPMQSPPQAVEGVIERIRGVYARWNRTTTPAQMRQDWDRFLWREVAGVRSTEVAVGALKARWIDAAGADPDRVLLYFHGGGYKMGSAASHHELMCRLSAAANCRVLGLDYRLLPEHRFPAPVEDAVAAWRWLLGQGYAPHQIAVAGDSAGGGLAAALLLKLREAGAALPAAAVLLSALTDFETRGASYETRAARDPIHNRALIQALARQYLGAEGDVRQPLASPLNGELAGLPPLLLQVGDRETGLDDSVLFADKAAAAGVPVTLEVWEGMIHVFQQFPDELAEARAAVAHIGAFLNNIWSNNVSVGILGYGAYIPRLRLSRKAVVEANAWFAPQSSRGKGTRSMNNWDEDSITMAVAAARDCLGERDRAGVGSVLLASSTLPFAERLNAGVVAGALDLAESTAALDISGSQTAALSGVAQALALAQRGGEVLLTVADARRTRAASGAELDYGDGAAALLIGKGKPIAEVLAQAAITVDFVDHFRLAGEDIDYHWEERWVRDEGIAKLMPRAVRQVLEQVGVAADKIDRFIFPTTFAKADAQLAKKCGIRPEALAANLSDSVGDTGVAHGLLLLAQALETAQPGQLILLAQFGGGAQALLLRVTEAIKAFKPKVGVSGWLERGVVENSYTRFLVYKGQLQVESGMRGEQDKKTALTTAWRHHRALLGLVGGRCSVTGQVHFPPSRYSYTQGAPALDTQEPYPMAERLGTVLSWSAEFLSFHLSPPHQYGQIDFDGGGRILMDFTDVSQGDIATGTRVEMVFRIKDTDDLRGFKRYFWKARPVHGAKPAGQA